MRTLEGNEDEDEDEDEDNVVVEEVATVEEEVLDVDMNEETVMITRVMILQDRI